MSSMYGNNLAATKSVHIVRAVEDESKKKIATLESRVNFLTEQLTKVLAENEKMRNSINRAKKDITLLTNAIKNK